MDTNRTQLDVMVILGGAIGALHRLGVSDRLIEATVRDALKAAHAADALIPKDGQ
jgi:fluoride ion exporter CrcB/FEX